MTRLRARVAERLKGAQNTYAMLTTFNEIDMTKLMQLRSVYKVGPSDAEGLTITMGWESPCNPMLLSTLPTLQVLTAALIKGTLIESASADQLLMCLAGHVH